jgi:tetrahydromethanopterin S-methyltransferase subunit G
MEDRDLYKSIGRIEGGIESINSRLDKMDKKFDEQYSSISELQKFKDTQKGEMKVVGIIWGTLSAIIVAVIGAIITRK